MKNAVLTTALTATIVVGGAMQGLAAGKDGQMGYGPRHSFEELDANGDGKLTREEMQDHRKTMFEAADTDGNGALSRDEMLARAKERVNERATKMVERMFERHDADDNGELSMDEMREGRGGRMFARADADGDGEISKEEFEQMRARHMGGHGHGHKHGQD